MTLPLLAILFPLLCGVGLGVVGGPRFGAMANALLSLVGFILTLLVWWSGQVGMLASLFGGLSGFVGLTAALANIMLVKAEAGRLSRRQWRFYHAFFQMLLGLSLLGLYAQNAGLLWLALAGETVIMALGISLYHTKAALKAAWAYLLLTGIGIGLGLFGTLLIYLASQPVLGTGLSALGFTSLSAHAPGLNQTLLALGFILILLGYGTKAAFVPLHGWLIDGYASGPMILVGILQGLFVNVALLAILNVRHLLSVGTGATLPNAILLAFAVVSLLFPAVAMARPGGIRRFLGFASSQHAAVSLFAFGIGGPLAVFGGLLHMVLHTMLKSGLFLGLAAVRDAQATESGFTRLRALPHTDKYAALVLGCGFFALSGLPPSGLFASEFIIICQTITHNPWMCVPLSLGLGLGAIPALRRAGPFLLAPAPSRKPQTTEWSMHLLVLHLVLLVGLAFAMPELLVQFFLKATGALS